MKDVHCCGHVRWSNADHAHVAQTLLPGKDQQQQQAAVDDDGMRSNWPLLL